MADDKGRGKSDDKGKGGIAACKVLASAIGTSQGGVYAAMWQRQIMEGEDFASQVIEFEGAKADPRYSELEVARERNARAAPVG